MGRKIKESFKNVKVASSKDLLRKALNVTICFQGEAPENLDLEKVFAVSPINQYPDGRFYRTIFIEPDKSIDVILEIKKVDPALVELENSDYLRRSMERWKQLKGFKQSSEE